MTESSPQPTLRSVALAALRQHFLSNRGTLQPSRITQIADALIVLARADEPLGDVGARMSSAGLSFDSFSAAGFALVQQLIANGEAKRATATLQRLNLALQGFYTAEVRRLHDEHEQMQAAVTTALAETHRETQELQMEISARKRAEALLERDKAAAEAASRAKSTFLANMSHELRTPLNAILGYAQILQLQAAAGSAIDIQPTLAKIRTAGNHLLAIISDVLDLSRIEAGKVALYIGTFDVATLIEELATTAAPLVARHHNTFAVNSPPDIGVMCSDLQRTRQVLLNLLSNAAKFTENGAITLSVARDPHDPGWVVFTVADTGTGIADDVQALLFKPFAQLAPHAHQQGGAGLGLAISRHLTRMLGGDITVASAPGSGSVFTVRLPAIAATAGLGA